MNTWIQPVCAACWARDFPGQIPSPIVDPDPERCCICGQPTKDGLYIRVNPRIVRFPKRDKD